MSRLKALTLVAFLSLSLGAGTATTRPAAKVTVNAVSRPIPTAHSPVTYTEETRDNPPLHLHAIIADLSNPTVHVKVSRGGTDKKMTRPWETTLLTVSGMAERDGLAAAINGSLFMPKDYESILGRKYPYYDGNWARAVGWTMSDGVLLSETPRFPQWPTLIVTAQNHVAVGQFDKLPDGTVQAVAGMLQVVRDGQNCRPPDNHDSLIKSLLPRTAAGVSRDGTKLILLVIDGRRPSYSVGATEHQLGEEMLRLGAWNAINLDSGGSSAMVVRDADGNVNLVNRPSDGHDFLFPLSVERSVADALGVVVDIPPATSVSSDPNN
jgi:exopolysaccharide biosynthesis protein